VIGLTKIDKPKVIVIGFDGASWNFINPLIKEGQLPNFEYVIKNGVTATMKSTIPPVTVPAWQCMFSGYNPGYTGAIDFRRRVINNGQIKFELSHPKLWKGLMLWHRMKKEKFLVLNTPFTYPPEKINGHMIPIDFAPEIGHTYPHYLGEELDSIFDLRGWRQLESTPNNKERIQIIHETSERILDVFIYLNKKYDYDISIVRFGIPDEVSHQTTNIEDIETSYKLADKILGEILKKFGNKSIIFIVSDHGLELAPNRISINYLLLKLRLLELNLKGKMLLLLSKVIESIIERDNLRKVIMYFLHTLFRNRPNEMVNVVGANSILKYINTRKSSAFSHISIGVKYVPIYLTNNDPKFTEDVIRKLIDFNKSLDKKIFSRIWRREELYRGPYLKNLPEIMVESEYATVAPPILHKEFIKLKSFIHSLDGIFAVIGQSIKSGIKLGEVAIYDVAPTIYYIFGYPIPKHMDGRVLLEIFEKPKYPVRYGEDGEEKEKIRRAIRKLEHNLNE